MQKNSPVFLDIHNFYLLSRKIQDFLCSIFKYKYDRIECLVCIFFHMTSSDLVLCFQIGKDSVISFYKCHKKMDSWPKVFQYAHDLIVNVPQVPSLYNTRHHGINIIFFFLFLTFFIAMFIYFMSSLVCIILEFH